MNKIILCEGETDAIFLSYYLGKVAGCKFCKKPPANTAIKPDTLGETRRFSPACGLREFPQNDHQA